MIVMTSPSGIWALLKKAWKWITTALTRFYKLEKRVSALEERLTNQPPEACKYCGALAVRMIMNQPQVSRGIVQQIWQCAECRQNEYRLVKAV